MRDIFRPTREPAQSIYDAFQNESERRSGRTSEEWMSAERKAVHDAAIIAAIRLGIAAPSYEDVLITEEMASGHCDYGSKWAYGLARRMMAHSKERSQLSLQLGHSED